jgi:hypothetical protein
MSNKLPEKVVTMLVINYDVKQIKDQFFKEVEPTLPQLIGVVKSLLGMDIPQSLDAIMFLDENGDVIYGGEPVEVAEEIDDGPDIREGDAESWSEIHLEQQMADENYGGGSNA